MKKMIKPHTEKEKLILLLQEYIALDNACKTFMDHRKKKLKENLKPIRQYQISNRCTNAE